MFFSLVLNVRKALVVVRKHSSRVGDLAVVGANAGNVKVPQDREGPMRGAEEKRGDLRGVRREQITIFHFPLLLSILSSTTLWSIGVFFFFNCVALCSGGVQELSLTSSCPPEDPCRACHGG